MKLFYSHTSPYSRKVRLLIHEKGLGDLVTQVLCNPFDDDSVPGEVNPLGKIPAFITDNGEALYDSPVICQYLDSLDAGGRLIPESGHTRWLILCWEALADGMTDTAYNTVMEKRRPEQKQSENCLTHWLDEIQSVLRYIENNLSNLTEKITLAHLALGAAIGYLEFRLPELLQAKKYGQTKSWYAQFKIRESMLATQPEEAR